MITFIKKYLKFILPVIVLLFGLVAWRFQATRKPTPTYETAQVQKGTFINSISSSGTITSGNYSNISTKVSGVVKKVYVTNGDRVTKGQKIAEVVLDDYARERQTAAWVDYLSATEALKDAKTDKVSADIQMWKDREAYLDAQTASNNNEGESEGDKQVVQKTVEETNLNFQSSQTKYLNADARVSEASAKVASAFRTYQENSATIVAPATGIISDLSLAEGITVTSNSSTSSTTGATIVSSQTVGKINDASGRLIASISLSEVDVLKVSAKQKVNLTLDAYEDKTFTGTVLAVNTSGSVSSGVTSYPVTILLDPVSLPIYPNMAVNAEIITNLITDVLLVDTIAITTIDGVSTVQVKKNNQLSTVNLEIGDSNDTHTIVKSGLNEGDEVVTSVISGTDKNNTTNSSSSPFSGLNQSGTGGDRSSSNTRMFVGGPGF